MTVTVESFRIDFPEFANPEAFPDSSISYWLNLAGLLLSSSRWSTLLDVGTSLFIAHNIVLERQAQVAANNNAVPGVSAGVVSSKSVDKVSVSYDTTAGIQKDAGHWNLTVFGTRFISLVNLVGAGPVQVGVDLGVGALSSAYAWPGPYTGTGWY